MWRFLILLALYLASTAVPLISGVGRNLEYEYALLASWGAIVLIPLYGIIIPRRYLPVVGTDYEIDGPQQAFWIMLIAPGVALVPPVLYFVLEICRCSRTGFAFWMAYLWYPAWILSHALLHGLMAARTHGIKRSLAFWCHVLIILGAAGLTVWHLWSEPQKRYLGLFAGFLHGPIYDELIAMDHGLMLGRMSHLFAAITLLTLTWWHLKTFSLMIMTAVLAAITVGLGTLSAQYPSMATNKVALDKELSGSLSGPGFTLHFTRESKEGPIDSQILRLYRDTEFHIKELTSLLQNGKNLPNVEIYAYQNDTQKKLLFGGGSTDVTDVKTPSVHISIGGWPHPTLRHELVHALASGFGFHGLGFHPNMAFTEGLAVALAPEARTMSLDDGAASLIESNRLPPLSDLFSPRFWRVSGQRAYTASGSFIRYLIETKGIKGVTALYSGDSWSRAFGASRESLVRLWQDKIMSAYDKEQSTLYAEALFRSPGLFGDICPHSKSDLAQNRDEGVYIRLRQPLSWDPTQEYLPWLTALDPKDQEAKLRLWRKEIKALGSQRFPDQGQLEKWRDTLTQVWRDPPETVEDVETGLLLSDIQRLLGKTEDSLKPLLSIQETAKKRFIGDNLVRETEARIRLEQLGDPLALEWRRVLGGFTTTLPEQSKEPPQVWLLTYLRFRNAKDDQLTKDELIRNFTQISPDSTLPPTFAFEWYRLLANRLMKQEDYSVAAEAYDKAASVARPAARELFTEHSRRARYYAEKGPLSRMAAVH